MGGIDMELSTIQEAHSNFLLDPDKWLKKNSDNVYQINTRTGVNYQIIIAKQALKGEKLMMIKNQEEEEALLANLAQEQLE